MKIVITFLLLLVANIQLHSSASAPVPTPWPEQFHSLLFLSMPSGHLLLSDLWYDWPKGRNVYFRQKQLGELLYDVEWNNGTSFYYTLGDNGECQIIYFGVGIPRMDFLDGAEYLGVQETHGFLCNVWEKVDFIWYYEDIATQRPVRWDFYDGISVQVMTYEVGAVLEDSRVQAPAYCFNQTTRINSQKSHGAQIAARGEKLSEINAWKFHSKSSSNF